MSRAQSPARWSSLSPDLVAPEVSNRLVNAFVLQMEQEHGTAAIDSLLEGAGLPRAYLEDHEGWVSAAYIDGFARTWARQHYGLFKLPPHDHELYQTWRLVGRATFTRQRMGALFSVLRALGSPADLYARVPDLTPRVNHLLRLSTQRLGDGHVRVTCQSLDPARYPLPSHACWNTVGLLEGIPTMWGLPLARVERVDCCHDLVASTRTPALKTCTYDVHFVERSLVHPVAFLGTLLLCTGLAGGVAGVLAGPTVGLTAAMAGSLALLAVTGWKRARALQRAQVRDARRIEDMLVSSDERIALLFGERQALRHALLASRKLSGYLASDLVQRIVDNPELELELGGSRTEAAVLFADIVGFTPRCEPLPPEEVVEQLNIYFAHVDPAFDQHQGVIDKRMGDGIMAVFVPQRDETAAAVHARAVGCGLDMLRALVGCNVALAQRGAAPMQIRVGVAAGPLVQGNMGSPVRFEYTVVGDTVNLAARLESGATPGHVLVSSVVLPPQTDETGPFKESARRTIYVKGKSQAVDVVELRPLPRS